MAARPKRGEIYLVNLDKQRPALVLSVNELNDHALDVCVVPLTTVEHKKFSMRPHVKAGDGGLRYDCWAKCDQVTILEKSLLLEYPLGELSASKLQEIETQVRLALGLVA